MRGLTRAADRRVALFHSFRINFLQSPRPSPRLLWTTALFRPSRKEQRVIRGRFDFFARHPLLSSFSLAAVEKNVYRINDSFVRCAIRPVGVFEIFRGLGWSCASGG